MTVAAASSPAHFCALVCALMLVSLLDGAHSICGSRATFQLTTPALLQTVPGSATWEPSGVTFDPVGSYLYVVSEDVLHQFRVALVGDAPLLTWVQDFDVPGDLEGVTVGTRNPNLVYIVSETPPYAIIELDVTTRAATRFQFKNTLVTSKANQGPEAITLVETGSSSEFFVGVQENADIKVYGLNRATNTTSLLRTLPPLPPTDDVAGLFFDAPSNRLFALYDSANVLYVLSPSNGQMLAAVRDLPGVEQEGFALVRLGAGHTFAVITHDTPPDILAYPYDEIDDELCFSNALPTLASTTTTTPPPTVPTPATSPTGTSVTPLTAFNPPTPAPTDAADKSDGSSGEGGPSGGSIAAIILAVILAIAIIALIAWFLWWSRQDVSGDEGNKRLFPRLPQAVTGRHGRSGRGTRGSARRSRPVSGLVALGGGDKVEKVIPETFLCLDCGKHYDTAFILYGHVLKRHDETLTSEAGNVLCPVKSCTTEVDDRDALSRHLRQVHTPDEPSSDNRPTGMVRKRSRRTLADSGSRRSRASVAADIGGARMQQAAAQPPAPRTQSADAFVGDGEREQLAQRQRDAMQRAAAASTPQQPSWRSASMNMTGAPAAHVQMRAISAGGPPRLPVGLPPQALQQQQRMLAASGVGSNVPCACPLCGARMPSRAALLAHQQTAHGR